MHRIIRIKAYEAEHGPHFNDEHARKAVNKMENEDGTRGQHWSLEETTALANQYGIRLDEKINKYDWYVALNMVYSDYYRVVVSMTGSNNTKYFVELAKAWMHDKDIDEGKMWFYYIYVMCDKIRNAEEDLFERHYSKYEDDDEEQLPPQQFPMPNQTRKKLVDIVISCDGESKKLSVEENKSIVTDGSIGLTVATDKQQIINMVKANYDECKAKKEAMAKYDEEMNKCENILKQLDYNDKEPEKEDPKIKELQDQVEELKGLIKQASNMVPPQMKQMLPQNIQKAMNEAS